MAWKFIPLYPKAAPLNSQSTPQRAPPANTFDTLAEPPSDTLPVSPICCSRGVCIPIQLGFAWISSGCYESGLGVSWI